MARQRASRRHRSDVGRTGRTGTRRRCRRGWTGRSCTPWTCDHGRFNAQDYQRPRHTSKSRICVTQTFASHAYCCVVCQRVRHADAVVSADGRPARRSGREFRRRSPALPRRVASACTWSWARPGRRVSSTTSSPPARRRVPYAATSLLDSGANGLIYMADTRPGKADVRRQACITRIARGGRWARRSGLGPPGFQNGQLHGTSPRRRDAPELVDLSSRAPRGASTRHGGNLEPSFRNTTLDLDRVEQCHTKVGSFWDRVPGRSPAR